MVYTNMLFALAFDKIVFDTTLGTLSIVGSSLILGSALYVAVKQDPSRKLKTSHSMPADEEEGLPSEDGDIRTGTEEDGDILRGVQEVQLRTMRL